MPSAITPNAHLKNTILIGERSISLTNRPMLPEMSIAKLKRKGPFAAVLAELFNMVYGNDYALRANVINAFLHFIYVSLGITAATPKKKS